MPASWLDIIDTTVKIGLGAAISGIATYSVTSLKHKSDKELSAANTKRESLHSVAEQAEEFSHVCLNYWARILDWTRKKQLERPINKVLEAELSSTRIELFNSYKILASAESKLLLNGEQKAQELLRSFGEEVTKFYGKVYIGEHGVSIKEIEDWRTTILSKRQKLFNELAIIYKLLKRTQTAGCARSSLL